MNAGIARLHVDADKYKLLHALLWGKWDELHDKVFTSLEFSMPTYRPNGEVASVEQTSMPVLDIRSALEEFRTRIPRSTQITT